MPVSDLCAGVPVGTARLVGGRVDPEGAWAYGRLEVFDGTAYSSVIEARRFAFFGNSGLGRNAATVACRSFGFTDGVEIFTGPTFAIPGPPGGIQTISAITCQGNETTLGDCSIQMDDFTYYFGDYDQPSGSTDVSVLCSTPSGVQLEEFPAAALVHKGCADIYMLSVRESSWISLPQVKSLPGT